jgi:hypothetical protein
MIPACAGSIRFKIRGLVCDSRSAEVSDSNPTDPFRQRSFSDGENDSHKIGSGGKLVKGVDGDGKVSLDEGNSR